MEAMLEMGTKNNNPRTKLVTAERLTRGPSLSCAGENEDLSSIIKPSVAFDTGSYQNTLCAGVLQKIVLPYYHDFPCPHPIPSLHSPRRPQPMHTPKPSPPLLALLPPALPLCAMDINPALQNLRDYPNPPRYTLPRNNPRPIITPSNSVRIPDA